MLQTPRRQSQPSALWPFAVLAVCMPIVAAAQGQTFLRNENPPKKPAAAERLGPTTYRIGGVQVDTAKKEVAVRGTVTEANILEFLAVTKGGYKGYESALELETNAIDFNASLILIGLDPSKAVVSKQHMDPAIPQGDLVEIWVEWDEPAGHKKIRGEELIYNTQLKTTLPQGPWVYTGSVFVANSTAFLADVEGSLIGFVHTPAPVIESPRALVPGAYGNEVRNPALNLKPGMTVQLTVRALQPAK
jgi:hypothetical protein